MLLLVAIYALNFYSRSLPTEIQKFFGNKFSESLQHFGIFRKYFSPKISRYTVLMLIILCSNHCGGIANSDYYENNTSNAIQLKTG